jgi:TonB family protein
MSHTALVRAEQDLVLRDSLAGTSLSALTVVVGVMVLSLVLVRESAIVDEPEVVIDWPDIHDVGIYVPAPDVVVLPPTDAFIVRPTEKEADVSVFDEPPPIVSGGGSVNGQVTETPLVGSGGGTGVAPTTEVIPSPETFIWTEELPRVSHRVEPVYPDVPRQAGMEGKVWVRIFVGVDGKVKRAEIEGRASIFDESALSAVRQWGFTPAKANGQPVAVWMRIPVVFTLD